MPKFYCWPGRGDWDCRAQLIDAKDEDSAAREYAWRAAEFDEGDGDCQDRDVEFSMTPADRPHRQPRRVTAWVCYREGDLTSGLRGDRDDWRRPRNYAPRREAMSG